MAAISQSEIDSDKRRMAGCDAIFLEMPFIKKYVSRDQVQDTKIKPITSMYLNFNPREERSRPLLHPDGRCMFDANGNRLFEDYCEWDLALLLDERGENLAQIGKVKNPRKFLSYVLDDGFRSETLEQAVLRIGDAADRVRYLLILDSSNLDIYKVPNGFSVRTWVLEEIARQGAERARLVRESQKAFQNQVETIDTKGKAAVKA